MAEQPSYGGSFLSQLLLVFSAQLILVSMMAAVAVLFFKFEFELATKVIGVVAVPWGTVWAAYLAVRGINGKNGSANAQPA